MPLIRSPLIDSQFVAWAGEDWRAPPSATHSVSLQLPRLVGREVSTGGVFAKNIIKSRG